MRVTTMRVALMRTSNLQKQYSTTDGLRSRNFGTNSFFTHPE